MHKIFSGKITPVTPETIKLSHYCQTVVVVVLSGTWSAMGESSSSSSGSRGKWALELPLMALININNNKNETLLTERGVISIFEGTRRRRGSMSSVLGRQSA